MTAWSAARLALKIALFTPSAGSLSESASSALGGSLDEAAHPVQTSNRPKTTAAAGRIALPRSVLRTARSTVIFSVRSEPRGAYCPERHPLRQDAGREGARAARYRLPHA